MKNQFMAVIRGKLMFYGSGKHDGDIQGRHEHTAKEAKFMNLFDIMLLLFCGKGHHVTCDSAYMDDIMAQIAQNV